MKRLALTDWILLAAALALCVGAAPRARAAGIPPVHGVLEHYFDTSEQRDGHTHLYTRWLYLEAQPRPDLRLVGGHLKVFQREMLDENYVEATRGPAIARVGRFRTAFGLNDWTEGWYSGFPRRPRLQTRYLPSGFLLGGMDTGADVRVLAGGLEWTAAWLQKAPNSYQLLPQRPRHIALRAQGAAGALVLGANLLTGKKDRLHDIDWRWSAPHVQVRGEYLWGPAGGRPVRESYCDLFLRPTERLPLRLLARAEQNQRPTFGLRYTLCREITLSAAYQRPVGWLLQTTHFLRF